MMKGTYRRKNGGPPTDARRDRDRDEDLALFREMIKRDKDRMVSLLQPVSEEFEPNPAGNYQLYRIPSAKKGGGGNELLSSGGEKNDYDWLKTPPATPLFPSLEMDAGGPQLLVQREIPILQPIRFSRFSNRSGATRPTQEGRPDPKPAARSRSITPGPKLGDSSSKPAPPTNDRTAKPAGTKPVTPRNIVPKISSTETTKSSARTVSESKPKQRGVSPLVRSKIPATLPGFSNETPPNLRTDRAPSVTRGRASNPVSAYPKVEPTKPRRQSCSPSVMRGRKPEIKQEDGRGRGRGQGGNGTLVFGSRMVEKVMNARKPGGGEDEKNARQRYRDSGGDGAGFGRNISRGSLETALKHMEIRGGYSTNLRHYNALISKKPTPRTHHLASASVSSTGSSTPTKEDDAFDDQEEEPVRTPPLRTRPTTDTIFFS